jgi:hypothetical protein
MAEVQINESRLLERFPSGLNRYGIPNQQRPDFKLHAGEGGPACGARALSIDLREQVLAAIDGSQDERLGPMRGPSFSATSTRCRWLAPSKFARAKGRRVASMRL